jgi:hypothetical protein
LHATRGDHCSVPPSWLVNPVEFQAELNNCAVAPRFALAALDHDAFGRLAV